MTRIACCQFAPEIADVAANQDQAVHHIGAAVEQGADVVVLPELATSGYMLADDREARSVALTADDPVFEAWSQVAGDAVVVGGFCELGADGLLYNSAVALDRDGVVAVYRKTHLWDREKLIFTPGAVAPTVTHTRHGAMAIMVCYDLEFAELTRKVAVAGAELIAAPVNWPLFDRPEGEHPGEVITAMSTARTNKVAVVACDRAGVERGQAWTEGSMIVNPDGWVAASVGPGVGIATAELDLAATHDKSLTEHVDLIGDRRLDLY